MRRRWWHRGLSALLALWFVLLLAEPAALHACPMHSGATADAAAHDAHAAHGAAADRQDRQAPPDAHVCTCLGDCSGTVIASMPPAATAPVVALRLTHVAPGRPQHEYVAAWVDFVLPFATAPPALAA